MATHAEIRVTSTCGQLGPEYYCKLVEHVFLRQPQCDICDANDHNANHPIDYAIDGTRRWWQSPSLGNGLAYENVNITIDLRQVWNMTKDLVEICFKIGESGDNFFLLGVPSGLRDCEGRNFAASRHLGTGAILGWRHLYAVAILRHLRLRMHAGVRRSGHRGCAEIYAG